MTWAPDYLTADQLKNYLHIDDAADDVFVAWWVTTVSRNIDDETGRQFGNVASAESRTYSRSTWDRDLCRWVTPIDDLYDTTDLIVLDSNANEVTDYDLEPENALTKGRVYERIITRVRGPLTISSDSFGWPDVPAAVRTGMLLQGSRLASRRDSPFGIAGSPEQGSEMRLLAQLDPDFRTSLRPLRRKWWAA